MFMLPSINVFGESVYEILFVIITPSCAVSSNVHVFIAFCQLWFTITRSFAIFALFVYKLHCFIYAPFIADGSRPPRECPTSQTLMDPVCRPLLRVLGAPSKVLARSPGGLRHVDEFTLCVCSHVVPSEKFA